MSGSSRQPLLGPIQKLLLVVLALGLAITLLLLRGGLESESPMEQLARRSLEPEVALSNGRPTVIEFYADWCQACREMAPAMLELETSTRNQLDVVLVNVDNPRWQDLIDRYDVNGIPQLDFFGADGAVRGRSIGVRQPKELQSIGDALIRDEPLPALRGIAQGNISNLRPGTGLDSAAITTGPRSHG